MRPEGKIMKRRKKIIHIQLRFRAKMKFNILCWSNLKSSLYFSVERLIPFFFSNSIE